MFFVHAPLQSSCVLGGGQGPGGWDNADKCDFMKSRCLDIKHAMMVAVDAPMYVFFVYIFCI